MDSRDITVVEPLIGKGISSEEDRQAAVQAARKPSRRPLESANRIAKWLVSNPARNSIFDNFQGTERVVHLTGMSARVDRWLVRLEGRFDQTAFSTAHICRRERDRTRLTNYMDLMPGEVCFHCGTESTASKDALALYKLRNVLRRDGLLEATRYAWYLLRNR